MLFVSKKEPLNTESLPDTSLHNAELRSSSFRSSRDASCCSQAFFSSSDACLPKLTKEDFKTYQEFLRLGSVLMSQNVDLFHKAMSFMSAKHNLEAATPATSISDIIPQPRISRPKQTGDCANPRAIYRKYMFTSDIAAKEFYECMQCKEKHSSNSFGLDHVHKGCSKSSIRWYCPLCDKFFAVTHRSNHIRTQHLEHTAAPVAEPASLKRERDAESDETTERECELLSPPKKVQATVFCQSPSIETTGSLASGSPQEVTKEVSDQEDESIQSVFGSGSTPFSPSSNQIAPLLFDQEDNEVPTMFSSLIDDGFLGKTF